MTKSNDPAVMLLKNDLIKFQEKLMKLEDRIEKMENENDTWKCKNCGSEDMCFDRSVDIDENGNTIRWGGYYCGNCGTFENELEEK